MAYLSELVKHPFFKGLTTLCEMGSLLQHYVRLGTKCVVNVLEGKLLTNYRRHFRLEDFNIFIICLHDSSVIIWAHNFMKKITDLGMHLKLGLLTRLRVIILLEIIFNILILQVYIFLYLLWIFTLLFSIRILLLYFLRFFLRNMLGMPRCFERLPGLPLISCAWLLARSCPGSVHFLEEGIQHIIVICCLLMVNGVSILFDLFHCIRDTSRSSVQQIVFIPFYYQPTTFCFAASANFGILYFPSHIN